MYESIVSPLILLCVEILGITCITGIGMVWDLKQKLFAVWHRNAAGYIIKAFFVALLVIIFLIELRGLLVLADTDLIAFAKKMQQTNMFRITLVLFIILLLALIKVRSFVLTLYRYSCGTPNTCGSGYRSLF